MNNAQASQQRRPSDVTLSIWNGPLAERVCWWSLLVLLFLCAIGGGASRADVSSLLYLRPATVICGMLFLMSARRIEWRVILGPLLLLGILGAIMLLQLIPLPPGLWLSMPGHAHYADAATAAGIAQPWRPISLTPALTLNSLVSLCIPLAVLLGFASIRADQRRALLPYLLGIIFLSAVLGVVQLALGANSWAYLYRITNPGNAVGFLSNRNHQAVMIAMALPALRVWSASSDRPGQNDTRLMVSVCLGLFFIAIIMVTGSRAGTLIGLGALVAAFFIAPPTTIPGSRRGRIARYVAPLIWITPFLVLALLWVFGRAVAIDRFTNLDEANELRLINTPLMLQMIRDFFPFGTGFGSFDAVFRNFEPDQQLSTSYFNHAHNDLIELALTGGLPALLILIAFLVAFSRLALPLFLKGAKGKPYVLFRRLGAVMILLLLASSMVDYPLRTPLLGAFFAIAAGWLSDRGSSAEHSPDPSKTQADDIAPAEAIR